MRVLAALRTHLGHYVAEIIATFRPETRHLVITDIPPAHGRAFHNIEGADPTILGQFEQTGHLMNWWCEEHGYMTLWVPVVVDRITWGREFTVAPGQWVHLAPKRRA